MDLKTMQDLIIAILVIVSLFLVISLIIILMSKNVTRFFKSVYKKIFKKKDLSFLKIQNFSNQLAGVLKRLSQDVVGGLIVIEGKDGLEDYVKLGYSIKAKFSSEFLVNIFYNKSSPLHDGGVIVRDSEIISVSSYFPMTKTNLETSFGARHRAAVGLTEETDALAFVVSETSGKISFAHKGKMTVLDNDIEKLSKQVYQLLTKTQIPQENAEEIIINNSLEEV